MSRVCVFGLWHLGSVTAACMASLGHSVTGLDPDRKTIDSLGNGKAPLFEPGLDELLQNGIAEKRLRFTTDARSAVTGAEVVWVTFDTPVDADDCADVDFVLNQIKAVLPVLDNHAVVLVSSQLPVGSMRALENFAQENFAAKGLSFACSPENLRLGKAINVFRSPDRLVVGVRTADARERLQNFLSTVTDNIEWMSVESAEMTKHAINAFLATSVVFANELAAICELVGADAKEVERGLKTETRIGPKAYLSPGGPFAGGTLARDVEFLNATAGAGRLVTPLLTSVRPSNDEHKYWVRRKLLAEFDDLKGVKVAVWGLTYKPGTNTLRRSLAVELCDWLLEKGAIVQIFDPAVNEMPDKWNGRVVNCGTALDALDGAGVLVVGTEWPQFCQDAVSLPSHAASDIVIIDPNRHLQAAIRTMGLKYIAVGTPSGE